MKTRIAIIGAGLSGLSAAKKLAKKADVTVFEKSKGYGGRMSVRHAKPFHFDHGAQFFTAKTLEFQSFLKPFLSSGIVDIWNPRVKDLKTSSKVSEIHRWSEDNPRYVAVPQMNALAKQLASDLYVKTQTRICNIVGEKTWRLEDEHGQQYGPYDWVISALPAEQSADILPPSFSHMNIVRNRKMQACYALMLGFEHSLSLDFDLVTTDFDDVNWIAINSSKPGRGSAESLVVHTSNAWADHHLNDDAKNVEAYLIQTVSDIIQRDVSTAVNVQLHRWRYAKLATPVDAKPLIDMNRRLAACGDWCGNGNVEAAFLTGDAAASQIMSL